MAWVWGLGFRIEGFVFGVSSKGLPKQGSEVVSGFGLGSCVEL